MKAVETTETHALELRRTYPHAPMAVYQAFTEPDQIMAWFGPEGYEAIEAATEPRPGGAYRIVMRKLPDGAPFYVAGVYRQVVPGELLSFTWQWFNNPKEGIETLVEVRFTPVSGGTELVIRHQLFPETEMRDGHIQGWSSTLVKLGTFFAGGNGATR